MSAPTSNALWPLNYNSHKTRVSQLLSAGGDDIVNGNVKIILGLVWSLVQRYQIAGRKTRAPPRKLMTLWFRALLPELDLSNFTSDWNDGIALQWVVYSSALYQESPVYRHLNRSDRSRICKITKNNGWLQTNLRFWLHF